MSNHKKNLDAVQFRVPTEEKVDLKAWPTLVEPVYGSKKEYRSLLQAQVDELSALQRRHYAFNRFAVLVIFQAIDAAGKDGAIRYVMSGVNPQGCQVFSFKHPSAMELEHDFLWRSSRSLPERGRIGIFNRSYYEEVLIARVHPEILRTEGLPDELVLDEKDVSYGPESGSGRFRRNFGGSRSKAGRLGLGDREVIGPASVHDFPRCELAGSSGR